MAINNVKEVDLDGTIEIIQGNALEIIPTLEDKYDFVFIDGMKKSYKEFLKLVWDKVEDDGVIILDDVIKFEYKMPDLYEYLEEKGIEYNRIPIDIDDGIIMIIKN
jgi:predicted O-methyltransferase YrrM